MYISRNRKFLKLEYFKICNFNYNKFLFKNDFIDIFYKFCDNLYYCF